MSRMISPFGAAKEGEDLLKLCKRVREQDLQFGRDDDEAPVWLASQVASFAEYIRVLAREEGSTGHQLPLIDSMIAEMDAITRYHMRRAARPFTPRVELFG